MRIQHAQQGVGQLWKFVVQPVMHPRREERDAFQQPCDMRVIDRIFRQPQPAGNLRMGRGKLGRECPDRIQFTVVIRQQRV